MPRHIRPIRIEGNIAYVPLTQGYEAIIDAADLHLVEGVNWRAAVDRHTVYAVRTDRSGPKQRAVYMHRVIMGEPEGFEVDHIDCDGKNNRRSNMREVTPSQNMHNQRKSRANTSGFKGVGWHKSVGKWRADIMLNGKRKHLGYFDAPEAAHDAYRKASAEFHGEYGRTE